MRTDILQFRGKSPIRVYVVKGEPWFVAKDVCDILGLVNSRQSIIKLRASEKGVTVSDTPGGKQEMATVNESGLYALIFQSRKPAAQDFRYWVTSEVLPCIRKHGSYAVPGSKERTKLEVKTERRERQMWLAELGNHLTYTDHELISRRLHVSCFDVRMVLSGHKDDTAIETELMFYAAKNSKLRRLLDDSEWRRNFINDYLNQ